MKPVVVHIDGDAIQRLLLSDPVLDKCMEIAEQVVDVARSTAPMGGDDDKHAGEYAESIKATPMSSGKRAWVRVEADVPYAMKIQADTGHLMQAIDAVRQPGV